MTAVHRLQQQSQYEHLLIVLCAHPKLSIGTLQLELASKLTMLAQWLDTL